MKTCVMPVVWLLLLFNLSLATSSNSILTFGLGLMAPVNSTDSALSFLGNELFSIYKLAIEDVNADAIAKNSIIRFSKNFSGLLKNENEKTCKTTAKAFLGDQHVVGVVGAFSSECSVAVQKEIQSSGSKLSQISFASTSAKLSDKSVYQTLFRTSSSDESQAQALADIIKRFRWKRVGMIGVNDMKGKGLMEEFTSRVREHGITVAEKVTFNHGDIDDIIDARLQELKNAGTRVNVIVAVGDDVLKILKKAKFKKMTGEGWVWIGSDGVSSTWLGSDKDVSQSANGMVAVSPKVPTGENLLMLIMSWFGKSTKDFPGRVWKLRDPGISPYDAQVYDAVFTYYQALDQLARRRNITKSSSISEVRLKLLEELKTFKDWISGVRSITGGRIYFDVDGNTFDSPASYDIVNYFDGSLVNVGTWNETSSGLNLPGGKIMWPGKTRKTPTDKGTPGKPLFKIGFIAPLHSELGALSQHGQELVSAAKVAVDMVNNDKSQKIELDLKVMDEGIDGDETCRTAAQNLLNYNVVAVVGGYRSSCSVAVSKALASSKTPVISYASAASILSDKRLHPYFFRTVPSDYHEAKALSMLITKYGFKGVGTLSSRQISALETSKIFEKMMFNRSIAVRLTESFPVNANADILRPIVKKIRTSGSHVNLVSTLVRESATILQQLKEAKITGKGWVWLASSGITSDLLTSNTKLARSMEGFLGVGPSAGEGSIYLNFLSSWLEKDPLKYPGIIHNLANPTSLPYTPQVFDAVNGIALSLSHLLSKKIISHQSSHAFIKEKLYNKLKTFSDLSQGYPSASGTKSMYFDANQDGPPTMDMMNFLDSKWKTIGGYTGATERLSFTQDPIFPGGTTVPIVGAGKVMYNVAAFFPKHPKLGALSELGRKWENALKATIDWINKNQSIAIGFKLLSLDGGLHGDNCGAVVQRLPDDIDLVIGEFRSSCTSSIYNKMERRNIPLISYGSTAAVFSNKMLYPYLFRTCPSDQHQARALNEVVQKLKWNKLGVISTNTVYGSGLLAAATEKLTAEKIEITANVAFNPSKAERITNKVLKLKSSGTGVNLVISQPSDALRVYQEAFEQGMTGKGWTWLGSDGAVSTTFSKSQHLQHTMQGMVGFRPKSGKGGIYSTVLTKWKQRSEKYEAPYVAQVMDAILAPSMALHILHSRNIINEKSSRSDVRDLMVRKLQQMKNPSTGFHSATGILSYFDEDQDSPGNYDMVNLNGDSWVTVGSFDSSGLHITRNVIWPGGTINTPPSNQPLDKEIPKPAEKPKKSDGPLLAVAVIFGLFGALVLAFMAYIIHRVRYRHLYMQSDVASGGLFSVLYGHSRRSDEEYRRPDIQVTTHANGHAKKDTEVTINRNS